MGTDSFACSIIFTRLLLWLTLVPIFFEMHKVPRWAICIFGIYEILLSLLLHGMVKYLSTQGNQYRFERANQIEKIKYSKAAMAEDSQGDVSVLPTNPDLEMSRVEKDKKIESIDGYEI